MEALLAHLAVRNQSELTVVGFRAIFLKPVLVNDVVELHLGKLTDETCSMTGRIAGEVIYRLSFHFGAILAVAEKKLAPLLRESVAELPFSALAGRTGQLPLGLDLPLARELFPLTVAMLGPGRVAATLALSRLIGMHCPGLHSIFTEASVRYDGADASDALDYKVQDSDALYKRIVLAARGSHIQGELIVFFRPPPQNQPSMMEVMRLVEPASFAQSVALVVGGSRGLGEITARLIAAGGGLPIITYYQGATDADRIAADIRSFGGRCDVRQFDVRQGESFLEQLAADGKIPRSLYYFATPKIFGRRRGFFDHHLLGEFLDVYVTAFGRLVDATSANCPSSLRVFYPSSIAVLESIRELTEYAIAKRTGEELCAFYNQNAKKIRITVERLPRIRTDQTSTLLPASSEDALTVMLPFVHRMETFSIE
jgi:hypothetical protein